MKLIHFSDTHLGFNDLDVINEQGINQREADFYDAFMQVVQQIQTLKPDYIIHTGDLFHRPSPSNHSTLRTNLISPILKNFKNFKNVYVSYNQEYKKIEFDDMVFHTLPYMHDESKALPQIERCKENSNATVLL